MENINPAAKGYVENNEEESHVDNEFIKNNKECWDIIKLFSDSPFLTQDEVSKLLGISKAEMRRAVSGQLVRKKKQNIVKIEMTDEQIERLEKVQKEMAIDDIDDLLQMMIDEFLIMKE